MSHTENMHLKQIFVDRVDDAVVAYSDAIKLVVAAELLESCRLRILPESLDPRRRAHLHIAT